MTGPTSSKNGRCTIVDGFFGVTGGLAEPPVLIAGLVPDVSTAEEACIAEMSSSTSVRDWEVASEIDIECPIIVRVVPGKQKVTCGIKTDYPVEVQVLCPPTKGRRALQK